MSRRRLRPAGFGLPDPRRLPALELAAERACRAHRLELDPARWPARHRAAVAAVLEMRKARR